MRDLIADRFAMVGRTWTDLATGAPVALRFAPSASRADEIVWNDQRAERARLRHPLLNVLVDYGAVSATHLFEAYSIAQPVRASGALAVEVMQHAARFLASRGLPVEPRTSRMALRDVAATPRAEAWRPIGVVLQ